MPPKGPEAPQGPQQPQDSREHKGLAQRLKEMLTGGNPDATDPAKQAELAAAREANNAAQQQRQADRAGVMQNKIDSGAVPVVTAEEVQTGRVDAVPPAETPENPSQAS